MSNLQAMKPCPTCGAMLTAALADAIRNPTADESCPTDPVTLERARAMVKLAAGGIIPAETRPPFPGNPGYGHPGCPSLTPPITVNIQTNLPPATITVAVRRRLRSLDVDGPDLRRLLA